MSSSDAIPQHDLVATLERELDTAIARSVRPQTTRTVADIEAALHRAKVALTEIEDGGVAYGAR